MQDFIESHITDRITLLMLARTAGYSPWHAARIFKEVTGKTPFEYIRALRLSRAAERLRDKKSRVVDVALDFVFDSHEGFTRAFSRQFGISPSNYFGNRSSVGLFTPSSARDYYLEQQKGEVTMTEKPDVYPVFVQVMDRPARKLILLRGKTASQYFEYCDEVGCDIWDVLTGIRDALYEPIGMWLPDNLRPPGTSVYCQGVEVPLDYSGEIPDGCEIIELKPCKMMIFQGPPYDDSDFMEAIGQLWEVTKEYNPEIYGFKWADEDGPRFQLSPEGWRGYIEGRPVRQVNT
jgi:AraC family transcriptional regulator